MFSDELGTEPGREFHELQLAVLRRDPALDAPAGTGPPSAAAPRAEERKTVTVLAADVVPGICRDDPEAQARRSCASAATAASRSWRAHGATAQQLGGGPLLGVFGVPAAQDDDSLRAVRAALALRSAGLAGRSVWRPARW